ncbi:MipA/OmpV family protein [uncultured Paraglaciecola sp.]|jgi:MipA family protein|uniref:MipA/OmpV family protein n=1 Tax=uncultured Paraglaciecola sp. TaxID=1765024 RepID=UPI0025FE45C3|nr:MipA/OmpV family protein [uncultured Paraglaciecola sp.]
MNSRFNLLKYLTIVFIIAVSSNLAAQQEIALEDDMRPVWEVGVFAAAFNSPEYPAAGQNQSNVIPSPYFIYRGETLRIGEGSIARAVAIDKSWYELDLSLAGSFNANSEDNEARAGMPDLDFIFELGPQLKLRLAKFEFEQHGKGELFLNLQARAAFSTDFSGLDKRGYVFQPVFSYRQRGWLSEKTALSISLSPTWATEKLHDYFYQVDSDFITDQRSAYDAKGGYLGTDLSVGLSFNATKDIRIFTFARASIHSGAENQESPLFKEKSTYAYGIGMVWRLWESEQKVSGR